MDAIATTPQIAARLERRPALERDRAPLHRRGRRPAARLGRDRAHAGRAAAPSGSGSLLHTEAVRPALGALTGNQAVQQVKAGLKAIYLSGWQVAADANLAGQMYPTRASIPSTACRTSSSGINNALQRADQIQHGRRQATASHWFAPIVADAEAGFGGPLNAFELMKAMIEAGAAGVHFEDQLASREEVRPHGRQGARADAAVHPQADGGAPGRRRLGRADADRRAHRRQQRAAARPATSTSATSRS